jgi:hypothetical protein
MGILRKKIKTIYNCKHCIAVDLILKHNQKGTMLGRVRYIIYSTNMIRLRELQVTFIKQPVFDGP